MGEPAGPRPGTADRERALRELSEHLGAGRLSLAEFDERSAAVAAAVSKSQLAELFADLPGSTPPPPPPPAPAALPRLAVLCATALGSAVAVALCAGNWLWLLLIPAAPALVVLTRWARSPA